MTSSGFWWTFVKLLGFMLVCGVVGPAFLVLYFVIDEPDGGWMLWCGGIFTALDVAMAFGFALLVTRSRAKTERLATDGYPALARIMSMSETATEINGRRLIAFELRVYGPRVPEFTAARKETVPTIAVGVLPKRVLAVQVDPGTIGNGGRPGFAIDWNVTMLYSGSVPAVFESVQDGRTYDLTGNADALVQIVDVLHRSGLPIGGELDVRGNPSVRDEVMEIVSAYGNDRATSAGPAAASAGDTRSLTQKLNELDALYSGARITREEYDRLRSRLLDES